MKKPYHLAVDFLGRKALRNDLAFLQRLKRVVAICTCNRCQQQLDAITARIAAALDAPRESDVLRRTGQGSDKD